MGGLEMNHILFLIIKFFGCVVAFTIGLDLFFPATVTDILSFSILVTVVSYVVGERIILPRFGPTTATIADFLLAYMSVWIFGNILLNNYLQIAWGSILSAAVIAIVESFVHRYALLYDETNRTKEREKRRTGYIRTPEYGTEFSEETDLPDKNRFDE